MPQLPNFYASLSDLQIGSFLEKVAASRDVGYPLCFPKADTPLSTNKRPFALPPYQLNEWRLTAGRYSKAAIPLFTQCDSGRSREKRRHDD